MRLREHTAAACLFILIICASASVVAAQEFMQPPFVPPPPGTPSLLYGRFYFQAGMKYRSLESLRFDIHGGQSTLMSSNGTVPFGPTESGPFGVGTGRTGFTGVGGAVNPWNYDNGQLDGNAPVGAAEFTCGTCTTNCNAGEEFDWSDSNVSPQFGRFFFTAGGFPDPCTCCNGNTFPFYVGSFTIDDPRTQANASTFSATTAVSFQVQVPGSLGFITDLTTVVNREMGPQVWSPVFEAGFQLYDFFDLFYGFSWFNVSNSTGISNLLAGTGSRTIIQDTFPFYSDDTSTWIGNAFYSANSIIGGEPSHNYQISGNRPLNNVYPTRQFSTQMDDSLATETIQENVSTRADINVYEFRAGARTWLPLFGLGRMGCIMGGTFMPAYYKITGNRNYVSLGPNVTGQALVTQSGEYKTWFPHYGAFLGGDLELGYGSVYLNGSVDYTWVNTQSYKMFNVVETSFNPGGMTVALTGGFHF